MIAHKKISLDTNIELKSINKLQSNNILLYKSINGEY